MKKDKIDYTLYLCTDRGLMSTDTLEEAVEAARQSPFLAKYLPEGLAQRYFAEQLRRCDELRQAADPAEFERARYFCAI